MFILKKLNKVEGKEQYRIEILNRSTAVENLDAEVDIRENIKISVKESPDYYEWEKRKPRFNEGCPNY
jgi:hypothetical protein